MTDMKEAILMYTGACAALIGVGLTQVLNIEVSVMALLTVGIAGAIICFSALYGISKSKTDEKGGKE